jgi:DNA-binding Lrp family transcriptional regulator
MSDEQAVLDCLLENARYAEDDIARMTGLDEAAVADALDALEAGPVCGYRPVVDWTRTDEERVLAVVECDVQLDRETSYGDIAERLAQFDPVRTLRLVSGDFDFLLEVEADSMEGVARFVADRVAPVPSISGTVTHYAMETYKEAGIEFESRDDDDRRSVTP